jgi:cell division transport system permease protein
MKSLKNHLSIIIPLISLLAAYQFYVVIDRLVIEYEKKLGSEYSIIIVSISKLTEGDISQKIHSFKSLEEVSPDSVLSKFENQFSSTNYELLKVTLPNFYKLNLETFPSDSRIKEIESKLYEIPSIKRVETFIKTHNQIYRLLLILNSVAKFFGIVIFVISALLIIKQVEVWTFEHLERMAVMELFGAPLWMRSAVLFRLAIIDSIFSALLVAWIFSWIIKDGILQQFLYEIDIQTLHFDALSDFLTLMILGVSISLISVFLVIIKHRDNNEINF